LDFLPEVSSKLLVFRLTGVDWIQTLSRFQPILFLTHSYLKVTLSEMLGRDLHHLPLFYLQ